MIHLIGGLAIGVNGRGETPSALQKSPYLSNLRNVCKWSPSNVQFQNTFPALLPPTGITAVLGSSIGFTPWLSMYLRTRLSAEGEVPFSGWLTCRCVSDLLDYPQSFQNNDFIRLICSISQSKQRPIERLFCQTWSTLRRACPFPSLPHVLNRLCQMTNPNAGADHLGD